MTELTPRQEATLIPDRYPTFLGITTDISTGNNEHLAIVPGGTGMVGIGTTAPTTMLDVNGTGRFTGNLDAANGLDVSGASLTVGGSYSWTTGGVITAATDETINGLDINAGAISDVAGYTQATGNFAFSGGVTFL